MKYQKNIDAFNSLLKKGKPDAIIFDWDNTLVDTWPLIHESINATMKEFGRDEWSFKRVKDEVHKSMRESFPELFGENWQKAGDFYINYYRNINLNELSFLEGALDVIKAIKEKNIKQFVVSNKIGITLRKEAKSLNVDDYFFSLIGASDADCDKPAVDPVNLALKSSGIELEKNNIWFVGDTVADINCAYNCQIQPVIFGHENEISKTISQDLYSQGKNLEGEIPAFFDHKEFTKLIKSF